MAAAHLSVNILWVDDATNSFVHEYARDAPDEKHGHEGAKGLNPVEPKSVSPCWRPLRKPHGKEGDAKRSDIREEVCGIGHDGEAMRLWTREGRVDQAGIACPTSSYTHKIPPDHLADHENNREARSGDEDLFDALVSVLFCRRGARSVGWGIDHLNFEKRSAVVVPIPPSVAMTMIVKHLRRLVRRHGT